MAASPPTQGSFQAILSPHLSISQEIAWHKISREAQGIHRLKGSKVSREAQGIHRLKDGKLCRETELQHIYTGLVGLPQHKLRLCKY